ncbi:LANO_0H16248g1_1 [Lachancea nothofagi CBS 11611]|uniref:LANO_0H16248g1_1 n=1 Tax=Lachancea nothofagi CBS 11611 TaxID=1266666 RepID=A0A1G4KMW4_9SACH|nr:LANO_0H16248g1_1 [Lachancea nothofagi CBS 11611]
MPLSKSLSKIQKNQKGKNVTIHPKGRKFQKLATATLREDKIAAKKKAYNDRRSHELGRVKFIQDVMNLDSFQDKATFSLEETVIFIKEFISRDDEELEELKKKRRSNRPPANRQIILQQKRDFEMKELETGFLIPDLSDAKNVEFLRKWNQTFGSMSTLRQIRVNDKAQKVVGGSKNVVDSSISKSADVEMKE